MRTYAKEFKEVNVLTGAKCDVCGKEDKKMDSAAMNHNDWGNDSVDSYISFDYCSLECYKALAIQFLNDPDYCYRETSEFDDIEIDKLKILINNDNKIRI